MACSRRRMAVRGRGGPPQASIPDAVCDPEASRLAGRAAMWLDVEAFHTFWDGFSSSFEDLAARLAGGGVGNLGNRRQHQGPRHLGVSGGVWIVESSKEGGFRGCRIRAESVSASGIEGGRGSRSGPSPLR